MPATPAPNLATEDIIEVTLQGKLSGQTTLSVLHYRIAIGITTLYNEVIDLMNTWIIANVEPSYLGAAAQNYKLENIVYQKVAPPTRYARIVKARNQDGAIAQDALTPDVCAVIEKTTWNARGSPAPGFGGTGLLHMPGLPGTYMVNGLLHQDYKDLLEPLGDALKLFNDNDIDTGWFPCLLHRPGLSPRYTDIIGYVIKPEVRVMRRRTVGLGI